MTTQSRYQVGRVAAIPSELGMRFLTEGCCRGGRYSRRNCHIDGLNLPHRPLNNVRQRLGAPVSQGHGFPQYPNATNPNTGVINLNERNFQGIRSPNPRLPKQRCDAPWD